MVSRAGGQGFKGGRVNTSDFKSGILVVALPTEVLGLLGLLSVHFDL